MADYDIEVDNLKIHIEDVGNGYPLVLIHGLGGPLMWQRIVYPLAEKFRVVVAHLPGFGKSESPRSPYSTNDYASLLSKILKQINIEKACVVGISYGGQVASLFSYLFPQQVYRLVLLCSSGIISVPRILKSPLFWNICSPLIAATAMRSEKLMCHFGERSFYHLEQRPPDLCARFFQELSQEGGREAWLQCLRNSFTEQTLCREALENISIPTLIIWGKHDKTVSIDYAEQFHQLVKNSRLVIIDDCAHSIPLEKPEELCKVMVEFFSKT